MSDLDLRIITKADMDRLTASVQAFADAIKPTVEALARWAALFPHGLGASGRHRVEAYNGRFLDASNGVPPATCSPWRQRYERRVYGRVLTPDERRAHWRQQWGGLAGDAT